jgi:hypothetical protein
MDFQREVVTAAPDALVPAIADRADDALEGLLDAIGVGEIVASKAQLPSRRDVRPTATAARPTGSAGER